MRQPSRSRWSLLVLSIAAISAFALAGIQPSVLLAAPNPVLTAPIPSLPTGPGVPPGKARGPGATVIVPPVGAASARRARPMPNPRTSSVTLGNSVAPIRYEETSPSVLLSPGWTIMHNPAASAGAYAATSTAGATVAFRFTGSQLVIYRTMEPDGGQATVTIDGVSFGTLEYYFVRQAYQVPAIFDTLPNANHTIVLTATTAQNSNSTGHVVTMDAFETPEAATLTSTTTQQAALGRVNAYRSLTGLAPVNLAGSLDQSSTFHAAYNANNPGAAHFETNQADPNYTGNSPSDRVMHFGYCCGAGEVADYVDDPIRSVDDWMATVYHRAGLLFYGITEIGYGHDTVGTLHTDIIDLTARNYGYLSPPGTTATIDTYPVSGQSDASGLPIPPYWQALESPNPLPANAALPTGFPVSLYVTQPAALSCPASGGVSATTATLTDATGHSVPVFLAPAQSGDQSSASIVPVSPLQPGETYQAHIAGTDCLGAPFDRTWSFTTTRPAIYPEFTTAGVPTSWAPGVNRTFSITVANGGTSTWLPDNGSTSGNDVYVAFLPTSGGSFVNPAFLPLTSAVAPGGSVSLTFTMTGPSAGSYTLFVAMEDRALGQYAPFVETAPVNVAAGAGAPVTEQIALAKGWNLISFADTPSSLQLTTVLAPLGSSYDVVFGFDPSQGGTTSYFSDPGKAILNNLTTLQPVMGYWVHTIAAGTLPITGTQVVPSSLQLTLTPGWNLVGFAGAANTPLTTALGPLGSSYDMLFGFDPSQGGTTSYFTDPAKTILNNLTVLQPQAGYWIHITGTTPLVWSAQ